MVAVTFTPSLYTLNDLDRSLRSKLEFYSEFGAIGRFACDLLVPLADLVGAAIHATPKEASDPHAEDFLRSVYEASGVDLPAVLEVALRRLAELRAVHYEVPS